MIPTEAAPLYQGPHASRCLMFDGDGPASTLDNVDDISEYLEDTTHFIWFDLANPTPDDLAVIQREFGIHPLAIEDAQLSHERPKIDGYDTYRLVVAHAAILVQGHLSINEIAMFIGERFVITIRNEPLWSLDEVERRWRNRGAVPHDSTGLLYTILDTIVDGYFPITTYYDEQMIELERYLFDKERRAENTERDIFALKRGLSLLRRAVSPMRDLLVPLTHDDIGHDPTLRAYFRDVYDHALRALEQIDSTRDLVNSSLDVHLSAQAHRQGEVSKQLTIIATIFLPLTYITGFFGQNFGWMVNNIVSPEMFWILGVGSQIGALVILLAYFKRKRWF